MGCLSSSARLALAGNGNGWGGGRGGEEGPDNKGYIQGLRWSWARRMESYSLSERPALARRSGPYKEMLFSPSLWGWDGALCPQDRAPLVVVDWGATRPSAVSWSSQWATSAGSACPLSPSVCAAPTPFMPYHSPMAWAHWRRENKTKQNKDLARSQASLLSDAELPRKQAQVKFSLFPEGYLRRGFALCPPSRLCTLLGSSS